ncbi:MAG: hypothetical protein L0227_17000 [Chloroflexi bacterium]|nr:hypothetical protein [Chloroflexota bacterium]
MRTGVVAGFLPSTSGFAFLNRWPAGPAFELQARYVRIGIGEVAEGLCGGMCFAAADRFLRGEPPPTDSSPPSAGSALFEEIAHRQLDSLELGLTPMRFWLAAARLRAGRWTQRDQVREWRAIRADIDAGRPASLGLVRSAAVNPFSLTTNHQVLGFAYEAGPAVATIRVYDPNHPGRDDVALTLRLGGVAGGVTGGVAAGDGDGAAEPAPGETVGPFNLGQTTGEPLRALLRLPYRPAP